jgi:hypothetical protein
MWIIEKGDEKCYLQARHEIRLQKCFINTMFRVRGDKKSLNDNWNICWNSKPSTFEKAYVWKLEVTLKPMANLGFLWHIHYDWHRLKLNILNNFLCKPSLWNFTKTCSVLRAESCEQMTDLTSKIYTIFMQEATDIDNTQSFTSREHHHLGDYWVLSSQVMSYAVKINKRTGLLQNLEFWQLSLCTHTCLNGMCQADASQAKTAWPCMRYCYKCKSNSLLFSLPINFMPTFLTLKKIKGGS